MPKPQQAPLIIEQGAAPLSKGQKTFNSQTHQIDKLRKRIAIWETVLPAYSAKFAREIAPVWQSMDGLRLEQIRRMDHAAEHMKLSRPDRKLLTRLILDFIQDYPGDDGYAELEAIRRKYALPVEDEAEQAQAMRGIFEELFGVGLGDEADPAATPDEVMRQAQIRLDELEANHEAEARKREEKRAQRKKSARQLEKEAREAAHAKEVGQSIRAIYRKLASALHPDREPDPDERVRKTALMQRINQAYDRQNLLELLELQLELEHIDAGAIGRMSEERLLHYNVILKKQVAELKGELARVERGFRAQFGVAPYSPVVPETALRDLELYIPQVTREKTDLERELELFDSVQGVKAWLKAQRHRPRPDEFYDFPF